MTLRNSGAWLECDASKDSASTQSNPTFFEDLVAHAAQTLKLDHVHLGRLSTDGRRLETLAAWLDGSRIQNWSYDLEGSPCAGAIYLDERSYRSEVQRRFPANADLKRLGAEGYVAAPVKSPSGLLLGLLAGTSRRPLDRPQSIETNLRILSARAGAEMERHTAFCELRQDADRLKDCLDGLSAIMLALDREGRIALINRAGCELIGHAEDALIGRDWAACQPPGVNSETIRELLRAAAEDQLDGCVHHESRVLTAHGLERRISWRSSPYRNAQSHVVGLLSIGMDVIDGEAEHTLAQLRERLRLILEHAPIGIWITSASGKLELANRILCDAVGVSESKWRSAMHYSDLVRTSDRTEMRSAHAAAIAAEDAVVTQQRLRFADGQLHDFRVTRVAERDAKGQVRSLIGLFLDVTEERRKLEALRAAQTELRTMLEWAHDWEYWKTPDGGFRYISPSVQNLTGYSVAELEACPGLIDAIVHEDDLPCWRAHVEASDAAQHHSALNELEFRIRRKDGSTLWVSHRCRPMFDEQRRYQGHRVTVSDIQERKEAEAKIRSLAYFDPLTGLPNRRLLLDRIDHARAASSRSRRHGAVLMLDLDRFKALNDTKGHDAGDRLLVEVARRITDSLRELDTVSRLGGDEFVILLEELSRDEARAAAEAELVAEKIRHALNQPFDILPGEPGYRSTPSIGIALFLAHETKVEALLKQADVALYQAKRSGRNAVHFFSDEMQASIDARIALEQALSQALDAEALGLFFQPQIDPRDRCIGVEAFVRWPHGPGDSVVSATELIPLAEETGLILRLGLWVVRQACAQLKAWEASPQTCGLPLAVNISARQLHQHDFVSRVRECLEDTGADPRLLRLELTESAFLAATDEASGQMRRLRDLGLSLSLDDFGTGYSSLPYLKRLPFDQLKIDQTFVKNITTDTSDAAIVRAILAMSQSLGLETIAEGVETDAQRDFLIAHGCHGLQGYLFGKPAPIQQLVITPGR